MKNIPFHKAHSLVSGVALALSVFGGSAMAEQANPFSMSELSQGYTLASATEGKCGGNKTKSAEEMKTSEAKCGEGKCGGNKPKAAEGKCGGNMEKPAEGKCGGNKEKPAEAKCGSAK